VSNSSSFIELPYHFLNPVTKTVWKLDIKDEKLIVNVPNFKFEIAPLSQSKFRPVNPVLDIELEFEKHDQNELLLMHLYAKGIKRATFEAL
jgi:hypothetical protein